MLSRLLPAPLIGVLTFTLMTVVLLVCFTALFPGVLLHCLPIAAVQRASSAYCVWWARRWVGGNRLVFRLLHDLPRADAYGDVQFEGVIKPGRSYLLMSNHQSWADILILFDIFHGRAPFLRFFLKRELIWVPIIGITCWAMDFPFMTRKSGAKDLAVTRKACEIYKEAPVTVVNFLEGTRFTPAKRRAKDSPYQHLLRPKAAGLAFTLNAMGEQFADILDVTLAYRSSRIKLVWSWLCGEQAGVYVHVQTRPIPKELLGGDYTGDLAYRERFQCWVNALWVEKDARLAMVRAEYDSARMAQTPAVLR